MICWVGLTPACEALKPQPVPSKNVKKAGAISCVGVSTFSSDKLRQGEGITKAKGACTDHPYQQVLLLNYAGAEDNPLGICWRCVRIQFRIIG